MPTTRALCLCIHVACLRFSIIESLWEVLSLKWINSLVTVTCEEAIFPRKINRIDYTFARRQITQHTYIFACPLRVSVKKVNVMNILSSLNSIKSCHTVLSACSTALLMIYLQCNSYNAAYNMYVGSYFNAYCIHFYYFISNILLFAFFFFFFFANW